MEFSPKNPIVQLCLQAMSLEEQGNKEEALQLFMQGWEEADNQQEKFLVSFYIARLQDTNASRLQWLETALQFAEKINDDTVKSALPALYSGIAGCYEALGEEVKVKKYSRLAALSGEKPSDPGPFYHGTRADLKAGELLTAGGKSNYQDELRMNHIYFTAMVNGAGLAAALARGEGPERVYIVEPTGSFENDPNVTDKKFPGNPTRSYRSREPLRILGEVQEWARQSEEDIRKWKERLASNTGEIID